MTDLSITKEGTPSVSVIAGTPSVSAERARTMMDAEFEKFSARMRLGVAICTVQVVAWVGIPVTAIWIAIRSFG